MQKWEIKDLESSLDGLKNADQLYQWRIENKKTSRQEFYLMQDQKADVSVDQDRTVETGTVYVTIHTEQEENKAGQARVQFFPAKDLNEQLDNLLEQAALSSQERWQIPESPESESEVSVETVYQPLKKSLSDGANAVYQEMKEAILQQKEGEFNSSELFVETTQVENRLSNGLVDSREESRIYSEVCFSQTDAESGLSEEFLLTKSAAHPEQLNFKKLCENSAEYAKASLKTEQPPSGSLSVVVPADVLAPLFHDLLSHVEAGSKYYGFPFLEKGQEVIPEFTGTPFQLSLDPSLDFAFASRKRDGYGLPLKKLTLISENKVLDSLVGYQMGQYTKMAPTVSTGNIVVEADGVSFEELTQSEDQVLEILQFSGLFSNSMNLTFSSEIRLAKLYDNKTGEFRYIKGGNLSGNLKENLKGVRFSKDTTLENVPDGYAGGNYAYSGPQFALLTNVSVSS